MRPVSNHRRSAKRSILSKTDYQQMTARQYSCYFQNLRESQNTLYESIYWWEFLRWRKSTNKYHSSISLLTRSDKLWYTRKYYPRVLKIFDDGNCVIYSTGHFIMDFIFSTKKVDWIHLVTCQLSFFNTLIQR